MSRFFSDSLLLKMLLSLLLFSPSVRSAEPTAAEEKASKELGIPVTCEYRNIPKSQQAEHCSTDLKRLFKEPYLALVKEAASEKWIEGFILNV